VADTVKRARTPRLDIAYEDRGDPRAAAVLLVHGFPDDVRTWDGVTGSLVEGGYRTLAPYVRGFGPTRFTDPSAPRSGQVAALAQDVVEFADAVGVDRFLLVGHDWGARAGYAAAALWPERVRGFVALAVGYDPPTSRRRPSATQARAFWYQWYFHLAHGRTALEEDRGAFCRLLWATWSPSWRFDEAAFNETARSFDNPDFVDVVVHYYRHRWGNATGDPRYDSLQVRLEEAPSIAVPTVLLCGAEDGANLPAASEGKERYFAAGYGRRVIAGVGHFVQREAPGAVSDAIKELVSSGTRTRP